MLFLYKILLNLHSKRIQKLNGYINKIHFEMGRNATMKINAPPKKFIFQSVENMMDNCYRMVQLNVTRTLTLKDGLIRGQCSILHKPQNSNIME